MRRYRLALSICALTLVAAFGAAARAQEDDQAAPPDADQLVIAAPASAPPNLVSNGGFDTGLLGWAPEGHVDWSPTDSRGNVGSGAGRLWRVAGDPTGARLVRCVAVQPGKAYTVSAAGWVQQATGPDGVALAVYYHPNPACQGVASNPLTYIVTEKGRWAPLGVSFGPPAGTQSISVVLAAHRGAGSNAVTVFVDQASVSESRCLPVAAQGCAGCTPALCLNGERFRVAASWRTATGQTGLAQPLPFTSESGSFWFFAPTNIELDVKVIDACSFNGRYWVFASGGTNVEVTLDVTDTRTLKTKTYTNPQGKIFQTVADVDAFATCP
jgi:hypothetical protein